MTALPAAHPDLQSEQRYVSRAYELLDQGLADTERSFHDLTTPHRSTAQAMRRALEILRNSRGSGQLVFGRFDRNGERMYVGRRRVYDQNKDLVVVSWHAPAAQIFYEASPQDPRDIDLKRVFVEEDRRLRAIVDEIVASQAAVAAAGAPESSTTKISDALLWELERSRDGAMREVVATIQREQFRIIRAGRECILIVQGGPGTGKTVVGLHRAAWLAFNNTDLRRRGLLVVAPNIAFLSYISGVLPSLDASDIHQADLDSLYAGEALVTAVDDPQTARVKGSAQMATVLARALQARIGWSGGPLEFSLGSDRVRLAEEDITNVLEEVRGRSLAHGAARDLLRQRLSVVAFRCYVEHQRETGRPVVASESTIRRLSAFTNALDRMWPTFTPEELLRSLYGTQSWLVDAAEGVLSADDRARLYRPPRASIGEEPWTGNDLFCLDELAHLLSGDTLTYGHVVVDEAQDLSPMQARALARRCPDGSFTVLGDLAQATGATFWDSWSELAQHLGSTRVQVETLSIGYRVPAQVLDLASRQLPLIAPGLPAPRPARSGRFEPHAIRSPEQAVLQTALTAAEEAVATSMTTALIVSDQQYEAACQLCEALEVDVGDGRDGDFAKRLTLVPVSLAKGLEFDCVVLAEPSDIVASARVGRRQLYIAMTRCTQELRLVYSRPLPAGLEHLAPEPPGEENEPTTGPADIERRQPAPEDPHDLADLADLVAMLDPADRLLVEALVRRLITDGGETKVDGAVPQVMS